MPLISSFCNLFAVAKNFKFIEEVSDCSYRQLAWLWEKTEGIHTIQSRSEYCISSIASLHKLKMSGKEPIN